MNRIFGIVVTFAWIVAISALVARDMPFWRSQEPPARAFPNGDDQVGIFANSGRRVGTTWVSTKNVGETTVQATTVFHVAGLIPYLPGVDEFICDSTLTYEPDGPLSSFRFSLHGIGIPVQISADRYGRDFSCTLRLGEMTKTIALDADVSANLGESVRPFTHLAGLHVGQTWRIRLINPLTLIRDQSIEFTTQAATVTRREVIEHLGEKIECFRIETPGALAWANDQGRVLRQEVQIPLLGRWTLTSEPFNAAARSAARAKLNRMREAPEAVQP